MKASSVFAVAGLAMFATAALAQTATNDRGIADRPAGSAQYAIGALVAAPRALDAGDPRSRSLSCQIVCSPFEPRQSIAQMSWAEPSAGALERDSAAALDPKLLRLDIVSGPARFSDGNFGTVRLSAVPEVETAPGGGINIEAVRAAQAPALLQRVENNRIVPRDPALPAPDALKAQRLPEGRRQLLEAAREALERDERAGGLGQMQVIAQSVEVRRGTPQRNVLVEGLQPGLTYKFRLVREGETAEESLAEEICRVPVCPADFVRPQ